MTSKQTHKQHFPKIGQNSADVVHSDVTIVWEQHFQKGAISDKSLI